MKKTITTVLALLVTLATAVAQGETIRAGLFIGVNEGDYFDEPLFYAPKDAEKMRDVFVKFGGMKQELALLATDVDADGLMAELTDFGERIQLAKSYDDAEVECVVYYSGHSGLDGLHLKEQVIPYSEFYDEVSSLGCNLKILIVDACNSGGLLGIKGVTFIEENRVSLHNDDKGEVIITSSAANEFAQENDTFRGSIFTFFFVGGLLGEADADEDTQITLSEAYTFAYKKTLHATFGTSQGMQHPTYKYAIEGKNDITLTTLQAEGDGNILVPGGVGESYTFLEAKKGIVYGSFEAKKAPRSLTLPSGTYMVRRTTASDALEVAEVEVNGGVVDLASVDFASVEATNDPIKGTRTKMILATSMVGGIEQGFSAEVGPFVPQTLVGGELGVSLQGLFVPHHSLGLHLGIYHGEQADAMFGDELLSTATLYDIGADTGVTLNLSHLFSLMAKMSVGYLVFEWGRETPFFSEASYATGAKASLGVELHVSPKPYLHFILPAIKGSMYGYVRNDDPTVRAMVGLSVGVMIQL